MLPSGRNLRNGEGRGSGKANGSWEVRCVRGWMIAGVQRHAKRQSVTCCTEGGISTVASTLSLFMRIAELTIFKDTNGWGETSDALCGIHVPTQAS
jgi:hypothetical protein